MISTPDDLLLFERHIHVLDGDRQQQFIIAPDGRALYQGRPIDPRKVIALLPTQCLSAIGGGRIEYYRVGDSNGDLVRYVERSGGGGRRGRLKESWWELVEEGRHELV